MIPPLPHVASLHVPDALSRVAGFLMVSTLVLVLTLTALAVILTGELAGFTNTDDFTTPMVLTGLAGAAVILVFLQYGARATADRWKTRYGTTADPDADTVLATEHQIVWYAPLGPVAIGVHAASLLAKDVPLLPTALLLTGTVLFLLGVLHALALALPIRPG